MCKVDFSQLSDGMKWFVISVILISVLLIAVAVACHIYKSKSVEVILSTDAIQIITTAENKINQHDEFLKQLQDTMQATAKQLEDIKQIVSNSEATNATFTEQAGSTNSIKRKLMHSGSNLGQTIENLKMQTKRIAEQRNALKAISSNLSKFKN